LTASVRAPRAVVFAYHDVGVRCLRTLLAHGVEVPLLLTHQDSPGETIWFESVAQHAGWHGIEVLTPENPNATQVLQRVRAARPDFLFTFYYRAMHGSLLPRYRGRAPVNWAVLHGEPETGATLHAMVVKPDAGDIVAQQAVPILPDDTAFEVFQKVSVAAELALDRALPALLAGTALHQPQDLAAGSYFGRRTARDGGIDWRAGARAAHNLIRAVAPPYPGAFTQADGVPLRIQRSLPVAPPEGLASPPDGAPLLRCHRGTLYALCHDGALKILQFEFGDDLRSAEAFQRRFGERALKLKPVME
jgi:methionyl-tRNA formyltransferase